MGTGFPNFYKNQSKRNTSFNFVHKKKYSPPNDKKKYYEHKNFKKQINFSGRVAQNFGIAFGAAWKAAN